MTYQENSATQTVVDTLKRLETMKWITINKDLTIYAIAVEIMRDILKMPYIYLVRWMKELLP